MPCWVARYKAVRVIEHFIAKLPLAGHVSFYRTSTAAEIDLWCRNCQV